MADALPRELHRLLEADPSTRDEAWDAFVLTHTRLLLHTARSIGRDHDVVMDAYAHVLEALRQDDFRRLRVYRPREGSKFTTWLVMVARRLCLDRVRLRYGQPRGKGAESEQLQLVRTRLADLLADEVDPDGLSVPGEAGPEIQLREQQLSQAVAAAVAELPTSDRLLLSLRFEDARSAREIAAIMRFPTQFHVYRRLATILETLKASLRRRGIDEAAP